MPAACWTCRSRTIRCDQTSIPCTKCTKAGLECFEQRPLRWVKGVAIRGKMRGRVLGGDSKPFGQTEPRQPRLKQIQQSRTNVLTANSPPPPAVQDPHIQDLDWSSRFYLDYYSIRIAKLYILYDSPKNPFRSFLTYAMDDSTLRTAILAVAARHFANAGQPFDQANGTLSTRFANANVDALYFKKQAIQALSLALASPQESQKDGIMATILLLIFLDILESGIEGWRYHLHGAQGLMDLSRALLGPDTNKPVKTDQQGTVEQTRSFVAQQLSLVSTIGNALSEPKSKPEFFIGSEESSNQESIIRSFLGCPGFLLSSIRYFSNQREVIEKSNRHDENSIHEHIRGTLTMLDMTESFDCLQWASEALSENSSLQKVQGLSLLSQAYKFAAVLYGRRVLRAFNKPNRVIESDNEELVLRLLGVIGTLKCDAALFKCLLWPTFIAGLESHIPGQQELVIETLEMLWNVTACLNVINASKILQDYWKPTPSDSHSESKKSNFHIVEQGWLLV